MISEEQGKPDMALMFLVKAAERSSDSSELWIECSRLAKDLGKLSETILYLKKAAKENTKDLSALIELYDLLNENNDDSHSLNWTLNELCKRDPTNAKYANELSVQLYQSGKVKDALKALKNCIDSQLSSGTEVSMENANMLASGYLNEGMNKEVLELDEQIQDAPADFRVNAAIALIRIGKVNEANEKLSDFRQLPVETYHEAYRIVADELMKAKLYEEAVEWLKHMQEGGIECREDIAYCLNECQEIDEAGECLKSLILDFPNLAEPPTFLYQIYKDADREEEVIEWLQQNSPNGAQTDDLVLKRAVSAYESEDIELFLNLATPLLCRIFFDVYQLKVLQRDSKIVENILGLSQPEKMNQFMLKVLRYKRSANKSSSKSMLGVSSIADDDIFQLAATALLCLFKMKRFEEALVLGGFLVICREKLQKKVSFDILFIFSLVAFSIGDGSAACQVMRNVLIENNDNDLIWEFFNVFIQKTPEEEVHAHKFLIRTLTKVPDCDPLKLMLGNHSQSTVWFDHAITQYLNVLKERPNDPIVSLLLAAAYLSKAYVRTQSNTRKSVLCAYACIKKYCELRAEDYIAEADYNLGRFYQTLKMYPHAERMYRKVLDEPVDYEAIVDQDDTETMVKHDERYSLKRDAAFNLALIYQESNPQEARRIYRKYLVIE